MREYVCTNRKSRPRRQTPSLVACPFELVLGRADLFVPPPYPRRRNPTFHLPPHLLLSSTPLLAFTSSSRADLLPSPTNDSTAVCFRSVSLSPLLPQPTYTAPSPPPLRRLRPGPTGSRRSGSAARVCAGAVATLAYRGTPRSAARKGRPPRACVADAAEMGRPTSSPASPKTAGRCRGSRGPISSSRPLSSPRRRRRSKRPKRQRRRRCREGCCSAVRPKANAGGAPRAGSSRIPCGQSECGAPAQLACTSFVYNSAR